MHHFTFKTFPPKQLISTFSTASVVTLTSCVLSNVPLLAVANDGPFAIKIEDPTSLLNSSNTSSKAQLFMGAKGGYQWAFDEAYNEPAPNGVILGVYGGLQFSPAWSWDIGYQYHDGLKADTTAINVKTWLIESALRYDWHLQDSLSLYGRFGVAYWNMEKTRRILEQLDATGFSGLGEIGISYHIAPHLRVSTAYQYIDSVGKSNTGKYDSHSVLASLSYTFKRSANDEFSQVTRKNEVTDNTSHAEDISIFEAKSIKGHFGISSDELSDNFIHSLTEVVLILKTYPQARAVVVGNSDSIGSAIYNQLLSERIAQITADQLISLGAPLEQIEWRGEGTSDLVADNAAKENRSKNRKVEAIIPHRSVEVIIPSFQFKK